MEKDSQFGCENRVQKHSDSHTGQVNLGPQIQKSKLRKHQWGESHNKIILFNTFLLGSQCSSVIPGLNVRARPWYRICQLHAVKPVIRQSFILIQNLKV